MEYFMNVQNPYKSDTIVWVIDTGSEYYKMWGYADKRSTSKSGETKWDQWSYTIKFQQQYDSNGRVVGPVQAAFKHSQLSESRPV